MLARLHRRILRYDKTDVAILVPDAVGVSTEMTVFTKLNAPFAPHAGIEWVILNATEQKFHFFRPM